MLLLISILTVGIPSLVYSSGGASICDENLPVVDLNSPDAAENLVAAFQSWGFSYVKGHKVDEEIIEEAEKHAKRFFKLPPRVKRQAFENFPRQFTKTDRGWSDLRDETLDVFGKVPDLKEVLDVGFVNQSSPNSYRNKREYLGENKWPANSNDLKTAIQTYAESSAEVAHEVLRLLAKGLGAEGAFDDAFNEDALQVQRLTNYPPSDKIEDKKEGEIGAGVHSDYGGITVLHADGPGLEILRPNKTSTLVACGTFSPDIKVPHSDEWIHVESRPGTFIVMGGEALQRLSNGHLFAVKHKVGLTGDRERHSLALFLDPRPDAVLEPLDVFRSRGKGLYEPIVSGHKGVVNFYPKF